MQFSKAFSFAILATLFSAAAANPTYDAAKVEITTNEIAKRMQEPPGAACNKPGRPPNGAYACDGKHVTECVQGHFKIVNTCGPGQTCKFNGGAPVCGKA